MSNRLTYLVAGTMLSLMFLTAVFSILDDSLTFDETAHIVAGYSYLTQKDMRLNPEHPPLLKDLAALPLLFLDLNFPKDHPSWVQKDNAAWWHQFEFATQFLYRAGNNPDQILFWSRLPMILLLIFLGCFLFYWTRKLFGNKAALLSLFLFSCSPTFLAHGRLVTTDVGAALGATLGIFFWLKFLKNPTKKNIVLAGLIFGTIMLFKFSLILLLPFFALITIVHAWLQAREKHVLKNILKYLCFALLIGVIGIVFVIWPVYQYHILNYPPERQIRDTRFLLSTSVVPKFLRDFNIWMVSNSISRALGQYLLGVLLVINRSAGGHTTYFLGEVSAKGRRNYFPIVYLIKEPLAFHILTLLVVLYSAWSIKKPFWKNTFSRMKNWIKDHFSEFAILCFMSIYWTASLTSNLNIGVRHLLPVLPFTILLVSQGITDWLKKPLFGKKWLKHGLLVILVFWQIISVARIYPHFLAYFNELAGGPEQGYIFVVNSNLDWGQDLKRLKKWVKKNNVEKIYVDYFGGGNPKYYLEEKYIPWWGTKDPKEFEKPNYLAVSASLLQGGRGKPAPGFDQPSGFYLWLNQYTPVAKIGYSIFVYYIE